MCDPVSLIATSVSSASGGSILPWKAADALNTGGKLAGGIFDVVSQSKAAGKEQEAFGRRAGQIEFDAKLRAEQTQEQAERRLGGQRGRFAKAGIKATGTAKRLLEEQIKQDELDLLKITASRDISIAEERRAAKRASTESNQRIGQAATSTLFGLAK